MMQLCPSSWANRGPLPWLSPWARSSHTHGYHQLSQHRTTTSCSNTTLRRSPLSQEDLQLLLLNIYLFFLTMHLGGTERHLTEAVSH